MNRFHVIFACFYRFLELLALMFWLSFILAEFHKNSPTYKPASTQARKPATNMTSTTSQASVKIQRKV